MGTALTLALAFLDRIPALLQLGATAVSIAEQVETHRKLQDQLKAEDRAPTDAEWNAINGRLDALEKALQA